MTSGLFDVKGLPLTLEVSWAGVLRPHHVTLIVVSGREAVPVHTHCQDVLRSIAVEIVPLVLVVELVLGTNGDAMDVALAVCKEHVAV